MDYTILDLEWNSTYSRKLSGFFNEIIQFGAVRLNESLKETGRFSTFVRPGEGARLTGLVEQLTSITNEDLKTGLPFPEAFRQFRVFAQNSVLLTWGDCDVRELINNYRYYTGQIVLPLSGQYINLQEYCQTALKLPLSRQVGLSDAAEQLGIPSEGMELHRAIDDSILSAECFRRTFSLPEVLRSCVAMDELFCKRLSFKNRFITDRSSPLVDRQAFEFSCPLCGKVLNAEEDWSVHNKQFYRRFSCPVCQKQFKARVQFKQKFDGIQVRRHIGEETPKEEGSEDGD